MTPSFRISGQYPFQNYVADVDVRVLSLGAGVQSSTLLHMVLDGHFSNTPDFAVFADTGWEPKGVYDHLAFLQERCDEAGFPLHIAHPKTGIREAVLEKALSGKRSAAMPLFVRNMQGAVARLRRQCTREFKIEPIERCIREQLGYRKRQHMKHVVESWQGISKDEMQRMRENRRKWAWNRYPLIEHGMTRRDCIKWLETYGYPIPPKSSCIGCPYHDNAYWRDLKQNDPASWTDAVEFDELIRTGNGLKGVESQAYLHRSLVPLEEVDLLTENDHGQLQFSFAEECEGICGV